MFRACPRWHCSSLLSFYCFSLLLVAAFKRLLFLIINSLPWFPFDVQWCHCWWSMELPFALITACYISVFTFSITQLMFTAISSLSYGFCLLLDLGLQSRNWAEMKTGGCGTHGWLLRAGIGRQHSDSASTEDNSEKSINTTSFENCLIMQLENVKKIKQRKK